MMMGSNERPPRARVTETATQARQGSRGWPVLAVLISALLLTMIAWGVSEYWGESIDKDQQSTASTKQNPTQPKGEGTFDDNPADGSSRPPEATDRDPTPSGNGGGPTMVTTPSGTEKVR
jgi:Tfp pilus assembly protein PilV